MSDTLVPANLSGLRGIRQHFPPVAHHRLVAMTHSRVGQVDQDFTNTRLGRFDGLDLGADLARVVVHKRLVMAWDFGGSHV